MSLPQRTRDQIDVHFRGREPERAAVLRDYLIECQDLADMPTIRSLHGRAIAWGYRGSLAEFIRAVKLYVAQDYTPNLSPRTRPEPGPGRP